MGKGEIARYEQFLLFPQCFQKACFPGASKGGNELRSKSGFYSKKFKHLLQLHVLAAFVASSIDLCQAAYNVQSDLLTIL